WRPPVRARPAGAGDPGRTRARPGSASLRHWTTAPRTRLLQPDEHQVAAFLLHLHQHPEAGSLEVLEPNVAPELALGPTVRVQVEVQLVLVTQRGAGGLPGQPHGHAAPHELPVAVALHEHVDVVG